MANIDMVTKNKLTIEADESERSHKKNVLIIGLPLALISCVIHPAVTIISLWILILVYFSHRDDPILRAGAEGEDMALDLLKQLPKEYTIFNQVNIPNKKSKTGYNEADIIVSGPNAVFLVEVKHNKGHVYGTEQDGRWQIVKKEKGIYAIPMWRKIQLSADLRNLCSHQKSTDPTKEQVEELISGVNSVVKSVF